MVRNGPQLETKDSAWNQPILKFYCITKAMLMWSTNILCWKAMVNRAFKLADLRISSFFINNVNVLKKVFARLPPWNPRREHHQTFYWNETYWECVFYTRGIRWTRCSCPKIVSPFQDQKSPTQWSQQPRARSQGSLLLAPWTDGLHDADLSASRSRHLHQSVREELQHRVYTIIIQDLSVIWAILGQEYPPT